MGDRTYVYLTVPEVHFDYVCDVYKYDIDPNYSTTTVANSLVSFEFEEINYGELHDLHKLIEAGIAFTSAWCRGDEYGEGEHSVRFTPEGEKVETNYFEAELCINYHDLKAMFKTGEPLFHIETRLNSMAKQCELLPWDNQVEYGKLYLTRKLLGANDDCDSTESA